ncbi:hypothetical protein ACWGJ2_05990 [Streptomyces sp. NPDC054796]
MSRDMDDHENRPGAAPPPTTPPPTAPPASTPPGTTAPPVTPPPVPPTGPPPGAPPTGARAETAAAPRRSGGGSADPGPPRSAGTPVTSAAERGGADRPGADEPPLDPRESTHPHAGPLVPGTERDRLAERLQHAVTGFVDGPRRSVEEADAVFDELSRHITDALVERQRALREPWRGAAAKPDGDDHYGGRPSEAVSSPAGPAGTAETEELRLALRQYREAMDRLLRM